MLLAALQPTSLQHLIATTKGQGSHVLVIFTKKKWLQEQQRQREEPLSWMAFNAGAVTQFAEDSYNASACPFPGENHFC